MTDQQQFESGVPPARPKNWLYVLSFIAFLALSGAVLSLIYGDKPKKYEVMAKRTHPPVRSVYALVLSPLDSVSARRMVDSVRTEVSGPDSSDINMIVASTALYKRFVSGAEFCRVLEESFRSARPVDINKQAVLISQLTGILIKDTLRTKLYLFGQLASTDFNEVKKQLNTSARIIIQRNGIFGPVEIESFLKAERQEATHLFLDYFDKQGIAVRYHEETGNAESLRTVPH